MIMMMEETFLTLEEVAKKLKISERSVIALIKNGQLKGFKPGKVYRIRESDFNAFVEQEIQRFQEK